ncbi:hypothetical protein B0T14DRAFT_439487 [Immersiella caudata]|uniref:ubiquitinyl hydrolase 1 n=1 Tax=Immersiella caudata TaxID=314043 RepID=A0AA39WB47_9PEZI|nr:hypothetical protein B0T14DRAFT_439487 [Immersiella caudata]
MLRVFHRRRANASIDHDLILIQTQTYENSQLGGDVVLSCLCRSCRYHFVFKISAGSCGSSREYPQHHFLLNGIEKFSPENVEDNKEVKLYPILCHASYSCTGCPQTVQIEITAPRLVPKWIDLITDEQRILKALDVARADDPDRYAGIGSEGERRLVSSPLQTLNHYLKDIAETGHEERSKRISSRNKTFMVQFGGACDHIFRYLGFGFEPAEEPVGGSPNEGFWIPPRLPPPEGKTPLKSERAFIEDVRNEVQSLLDEAPPGSVEVVKLVCPPARGALEKVLKVVLGGRKSGDKEQAADFRILGAEPDADDETLKFAYQRQVHTDPGRKAAYLAALKRLGTRRDIDFQVFCVSQDQDQAQPDKKASDDPVDKAYAHFNLERTYSGPESYIVTVYRTFREQSPAQKAAHRVNLLQIGKDRSSSEILGEVYGAPMEHSEACSFLGVDPAWPLESIAMSAQSTVQELDLDLTIMALEKIGIDSTPNSNQDKDTFDTILADLRSQRASQNAIANLDASNVGDQTGGCEVDQELPVGLGNLRNTCYLNSILQYFYSVNAVRDLVLSSDQSRLMPTEQDVQEALKNLDPAELEPGRAFVGSEFSRELHTLFETLKVSQDRSVTPRQRLANAALLRPEKIRPKVEEAAPVIGPPNKDAPPLPPRAGESSELKVTVDAVPESSETASIVSSQTLVDRPDDDPSSYVVVSRDTTDKDESANMDIDAPEQLGVTSPKDAEPKNSKLTVEELAAELDKPNVGSDQMDVDEVMGNAIDHLRASYKVARVGQADADPDPIERAFFSKFIDNRKKTDEDNWNRSRRSDRWVTAYPAKTGRRDLYEALAISFDLERLPGDLLSFTTIEEPAPNFHICIQRSDGVSKNSNPIEIPETLYLDRFMHTPDICSDLSQSKKRAWDIKTRTNEIAPANREPAKEACPAARSASLAPKSNPEDLADMDEVDGFLLMENQGGAENEVVASTTTNDTMGALEDDWRVIDTTLGSLSTSHADVKAEYPATTLRPTLNKDVREPKPKAATEMEKFWLRFDAAEDDELTHLKAEKEEMFKNKKSVAYRLHAVVCHAGATASAGHYWVWIHDFEQDVWRKYNDTRVSVHPAEFVFEELNTKGEPYYLAYVRESDISQLVSTPRRQNPSPEIEMTQAPQLDGNADVDTDPPPYAMH